MLCSPVVRKKESRFPIRLWLWVYFNVPELPTTLRGGKVTPDPIVTPHVIDAGRVAL